MAQDLERITEIEVFNYRISFCPIFRSDEFYFDEFCVSARMEEHRNNLHQFWIYDDGVIKGFIQVEERETGKLFVDPVLQWKGIGERLLEYAIENMHAKSLWALEKNVGANDFIYGTVLN